MCTCGKEILVVVNRDKWIRGGLWPHMVGILENSGAISYLGNNKHIKSKKLTLLISCNKPGFEVYGM